MGDRQNRVLVSVFVLWEIALKRSIGKLVAPIDPSNDVERAGFELLSLDVAHIVAAEQLPQHHRDPFDRMLVAQAIVEGASIVSRDANLSRYSAQVIRA